MTYLMKATILQHNVIAFVQAEAAERTREAEELRQQLSSGAQHADALAAAQSQVHDLEQQLGQVQAALQQETSTAQQALQVCPSPHDVHMYQAACLNTNKDSALHGVYLVQISALV